MLLDGTLGRTNGHGRKFQNRKSKKCPMQCITESLAESPICLFHRCQLIHGSQLLDHCWRNEAKRPTAGSISDTVHLVKPHEKRSCLSSCVQDRIHISESSTRLFTYGTKRFPKRRPHGIHILLCPAFGVYVDTSDAMKCFCIKELEAW